MASLVAVTPAVLVALGAAVGAPLRYLTSHWLRLRWGTTPVAGTLTVNTVGSFVLGVLIESGVHGSWLALLGTGFCGAYTTFSTLALEIWDAFADDRRVHGVTALVLNLGLGLAAARLGWALAS